MFSSLGQLFKGDGKNQDSKHSDEYRLRVATCVLLLEAAYADDDFSEEECKAIEKMVGQRFNLDQQETLELLSMAEAERENGADLYSFARLVNEQYERPRKLAVLDLLWEIVYNDGILEAHEDALMHKLGTLLGVRHEELMALKVSVRKRMGLS